MNKKKKMKNMISQELVIPEIVLEKENEAFEQIMRGSESREVNKQDKKIRRFKLPTSIAASIAIAALVSITAYAAVHHIWNRGMKGALQATDEQQQQLTNQGMAEVFSEKNDYKNYAVTDKGITICPETVVADERYVFVSFSVSGFELANASEPVFESLDCYLKTNTEGKTEAVNMHGASFYDGTMEFTVCISKSRESQILLGENLCINLAGLGTVNNATYTKMIDGKWNFEIPLPKKSSAKTISIKKEIPKTVFSIEDISISPISIEIKYSVNGEVQITKDENCVPQICGVVLSDGTKITNLSNGNSAGYFDDSYSSAYARSSFNQVVSVDKISALLIQILPGTEPIEVTIR